MSAFKFGGIKVTEGNSNGPSPTKKSESPSKPKSSNAADGSVFRPGGIIVTEGPSPRKSEPNSNPSKQPKAPSSSPKKKAGGRNAQNEKGGRESHAEPSSKSKYGTLGGIVVQDPTSSKTSTGRDKLDKDKVGSPNVGGNRATSRKGLERNEGFTITGLDKIHSPSKGKSSAASRGNVHGDARPDKGNNVQTNEKKKYKSPQDKSALKSGSVVEDIVTGTGRDVSFNDQDKDKRKKNLSINSSSPRKEGLSRSVQSKYEVAGSGSRKSDTEQPRRSPSSRGPPAPLVQNQRLAFMKEEASVPRERERSAMPNTQNPHQAQQQQHQQYQKPGMSNNMARNHNQHSNNRPTPAVNNRISSGPPAVNNRPTSGPPTVNNRPNSGPPAVNTKISSDPPTDNNKPYNVSETDDAVDIRKSSNNSNYNKSGHPTATNNNGPNNNIPDSDNKSAPPTESKVPVVVQKQNNQNPGQNEPTQKFEKPVWVPVKKEVPVPVYKKITDWGSDSDSD